MPLKNSLLLFAFLISTFSCASNGGGGSTDDSVSEGGDSQEDMYGGGSVSDEPEETEEREAYQRGDLIAEVRDSGATVTIRGQEFEFSVEDKFDQSIIYQKIDYGQWDYYGAGFNGRYVDGAAFAWFRNGDVTSGSDYWLMGNLTNPNDLPSSLYVYDGVFIVTRPWLTDDGRVVVSQMRWYADFSTGEFTGSDHPEQAVVFFEGEIEGNTVRGSVVYQLGRDEFEAGFFGPNAEEFAGGFQNGGVSVVFFGDYNAFVSDQVD